MSFREKDLIPLDMSNCGCSKQKHQGAFGGLDEKVQKKRSGQVEEVRGSPDRGDD